MLSEIHQTQKDKKKERKKLFNNEVNTKKKERDRFLIMLLEHLDPAVPCTF